MWYQCTACNKTFKQYDMIPCPDGKADCLVAHFGPAQYVCTHCGHDNKPGDKVEQDQPKAAIPETFTWTVLGDVGIYAGSHATTDNPNVTKDAVLKKHPMQPIELDQHGVARFKENKIVRHLLDHGGVDLNHLARLSFSREDRSQFAQLIGYSVSGWGDLSYVDPDEIAAADLLVENPGLSVEEAKIATLTEQLNRVRAGMREAVADLYNVHPDDLQT